MDFKLALTIQRPVEEVFAFVADFTHLPLWNYWRRSKSPPGRSESALPIPKAIARRITLPIEQAVGENLSRLKMLLETGSVVLQDGRVVSR